MGQAALDASLAWSRERELFGGRLIDQQATQHTLAEMATRIEAGRLLVRRAAAAYDGGAPAHRDHHHAAQAKLFATETAQWVVDQAVQLHGARGLQRGHLLERLYREVRAPRIYEGASEVQRTIIARGLHERRAVSRYRASAGDHRRLAALRLLGRRRRRHGDPRTVPRS